MNLRPIKACNNCGASYTLPMWEQLQPGFCAVPGTERRRCACGNELALDRAAAESVADALPPPEHTASRADPPDEALCDGSEMLLEIGSVDAEAVAALVGKLVGAFLSGLVDGKEQWKR
jgi:hypothetical protein